MDISVIGAGGAIGREIAAHIVSSRVLRPTERLQLVGNPRGASASTLFGLRSDLTDAYAETAPQIDVAFRPEDVVGDLIVFAAGATMIKDDTSRDNLANTNVPLFREYARALATHGHGYEIVLMVSNPVELGVSVFAKELGPQRVIGIGCYSDTLRFRREIAADLGIPRQMVSGYVVGEHGENMVPLWSSVRIYGFSDAESSAEVEKMRGTSSPLLFSLTVAQMARQLHHLIAHKTQEAYDAIEELTPDMRVALRPHITQMSGSRTVMATTNATLAMVHQIVKGHEMSVAGQILLQQSDFCGVKGVFGVPLLLSNQGVVRVINPHVDDIERKAIANASDAIQAKLKRWEGD